MKQFFATITFMISLAAATGTSAQCVPNNDTVSGIEPDTLAVAYANILYEQVIYFRLPSDTDVLYVIGPDTVLVHVCIDSLTIDSVKGLPANFSYSCNLPWCSVHGGTNGCASISGSPTDQQVGIYPLQVYVTIYTNDCYGFALPVQNDTVLFYFIDIESYPLGAQDIKSDHGFAVGATFPNPASGVAALPVYALHSGSIQITISDLEGRELQQQEVTVPKGYSTQELNVAALSNGMYLLSVSMQGKTFYQRLQILKQ